MRTFGGRDYGSDVPRELPDTGGGGTAPDKYPKTAPGSPPREPYPQREEPRGRYDNDRNGGRQKDNGGGGYGGGRSGGGRDNYNRDPNYAFISYLYPSGRNGGFSVFLKRDMLEILASLADDDVLGISPSGRDGWMFYARRIDQKQKDDYRNRGGGNTNRGGYRR